ncbi:MAG TPA: hypothetical protein VHK47_01005 [Polyangia bacterium]|jgi:hypothetical protein|nr:hypothetical protein [Polyangia bacterium]
MFSLRSLSPIEWRRVMLVVAVLQLAGALMFALTVRHDVFDEGAYEADCGRYERMGATAAAIRAHTSPAGPGMPIIASIGGRLVPGSLVARRIPVFLAWVVAVGLLVGLSRQRREDAVIPVAGAVLLAYPHSPLSMATLLSEGPAFGCAVAALLASGLARAGAPRSAPPLHVFLAGLCLGLGLWFRQYYLALVPAFVVGYWFAPERLRSWALFALGPMVAVAVLFSLWGGLANPTARIGGGMYGANVQVKVALNLLRPFSALAYVGAYALPLLPWGDRERLPRPLLAKLAGIGFAVALAIVASGRSVWGQGPILSLISGMRRVHPTLQLVADAAVSGVAFIGVLVLAWLVWTSRDERVGTLVPFCAAAVVFFALEQLGISGGIPFYERYAHQVVFFSTALVLLVSPPRTGRVLAFVGALILISQWTLWSKA